MSAAASTRACRRQLDMDELPQTSMTSLEDSCWAAQNAEQLIIYEPQTADEPENMENVSTPNEQLLLSEEQALVELQAQLQQRKLKRNSGAAYRGCGGQYVPAKSFLDRPCCCRWQCSSRISTNERQQLFDDFWQLGDFNLQQISLHGMVRAARVQRRRPTNNAGTPRLNAFQYRLQPRQDAAPLRVCKRYFLDTFQISHGRLYRCCSQPSLEQTLDRRGQRGSEGAGSVAAQTQHVSQHVRQFAAHRRRYRSTSLTVRKMYDLYVAECARHAQSPVSEAHYYAVFDAQSRLILQQRNLEHRTQRRCKRLLLRQRYTAQQLRLVVEAMQLRRQQQRRRRQTKRDQNKQQRTGNAPAN